MGKGILERIMSPMALVFLASIVYNILKFYGVVIPEETFKILVDGISYILIGTTIYFVGVKPVKQSLDTEKPKGEDSQ